MPIHAAFNASKSDPQPLVQSTVTRASSRLGFIPVAGVLAAFTRGCVSSSLLPVADYSGDKPFSEAEVVAGSTSTPERCAATDQAPTKQAATNQAIWVTAAGHSECLRYFASPRVGQDHQVIIHLDGDWLVTKNGHVYAGDGYANKTQASLTAWAEGLQQANGIAVVDLARPGTMGSSGDQNLRRRQLETLEVNETITQLKARLHISDLAIAGQSGGGGLVAALLAERSDIRCAVASSGVEAVRIRNQSKVGGDPTGTP